MAIQIQTRVTAQPLNVVLRPLSLAEASYRSDVVAHGFDPAPGRDLQFLGGRTIPHLAYRSIYLGRWEKSEWRSIDRALAAAMMDPGLNDIVAQYFPSQTITTRFIGSRAHAGVVPRHIDKPTIEAFVTHLAATETRAGFDPSLSVVCLLLPKGVVLVEGEVSSEDGLAGFHGSVHMPHKTVYYAVAVYSEGANGIVGFEEPWKNVCATLYHELQEVRTDPDVEDAIRAGHTPAAARLLGWYSPSAGEIGDIPMTETRGNLKLVLQEVPLADGTTAPVQLLWSNRVGGPEAPVAS
jgi:hypothetical protein